MENSKAAESRNLGVRVRTTRGGEKGGRLAKDCEGFTIDSKEALSVVCIPNERPFCDPVPFMGGEYENGLFIAIQKLFCYDTFAWTQCMAPSYGLGYGWWKMNESLKRWILNWLAGLERFFIKRYLPNNIFFGRNIVANIWPIFFRE